MESWRSFREQFPVCENIAYLNHAAVSPVPLKCKEYMQNYLDELTRFGAMKYPASAFCEISATRKLGADLLGCDPDQVFFVRSTSQGLGIAATGIPFQSGDNLVLVEGEFPANLRPWMPL